MSPSSRPPHERPLLVTAGEFFLDLIFFNLAELPRLGEELKTDNFSVAPGGGAAITAAAAARLGRRTRLVSAWGDSPLDLSVRAILESFQVDWSWTREYSGSMSGLTVAVSTPQDRYFLTFPGANRYVEELLLSESTCGRLCRAEHVHLALTPTAWDPFRLLVEQLQAAGATVSWDLGWDPAAAESPGFRSLCAKLDLLFLNEMEALRYTGAKRPDDAVAELLTGRNAVVVKLGERGALGGGPSREVCRVGGLTLEAVDTTGAGDAFNGGFLHAWMGGADLPECLRAGNVCGGLSVRAPGGVAALPSPREFAEALRQLRESP